MNENWAKFKSTFSSIWRVPRDFDVINALSKNLFVFIDSVAARLVDRLGRSKSALLSHFLSSDFAGIVIVITKEEIKEQKRRNSDLRIIETNHKTQEKIDRNNDVEVLPIDRNTLTLVNRDVFAPTDQNTSALADKNTLAVVDRDIPADREESVLIDWKALVLANWDAPILIEQNTLVSADRDTPADNKTLKDEDPLAPANR